MMADVQNRCRICLDTGSSHISVLGDPTIYLHIKSCLSINILSNDDLPKKICASCVSQLREFYNFQLNAKCSQDWLESIVNEKKKSTELKLHVQPLPDCEYNSDSLLEFLNNTANIEDYLNNLGKDDIPSIVNILDRTAEATDRSSLSQKTKQSSPKKKDSKATCINMDIDVLDSDIEIVHELLLKETEPKKSNLKNTEHKLSCFGCKQSFENMNKLCYHLSICDMAIRTCIYCDMLFDSKSKLKKHTLTHSTVPQLACNCSKTFESQETFLEHYKTCNIDHMSSMGYTHRCKECGEKFQQRFDLYKHAKKHVMAAQKRICDVCGHFFVGDEELNNHKKEVHDIPIGFLFKCKICSLTGNNRKEIYQHIQRHLDLQELCRHLCEHCGRSFSSRTTLLRHSQQHVPIHIHRCSLCNMTFTNENARDQHLLQHTETVMCDKCGLSVFSNKLNIHNCT
ncbi:zinc finger protein 711-like [Epargyreus clarus]|uniref:zinc finger protein 711-like n=1 Tax=Epargyreus clarus TaxID=520877 RepID=UPI003C30844B